MVRRRVKTEFGGRREGFAFTWGGKCSKVGGHHLLRTDFLTMNLNCHIQRKSLIPSKQTFPEGETVATRNAFM